METPKGAYKDYSPFKRGLFGFPCSFGRVYCHVLFLTPFHLTHAHTHTHIHSRGRSEGSPCLATFVESWGNGVGCMTPSRSNTRYHRDHCNRVVHWQSATSSIRLRHLDFSMWILQALSRSIQLFWAPRVLLEYTALSFKHTVFLLE